MFINRWMDDVKEGYREVRETKVYPDSLTVMAIKKMGEKAFEHYMKKMAASVDAELYDDAIRMMEG